jgi:peptidoglycan/xylan/chitin deacetylase (PgdA/CDA1 family)
MRPAAKKHGLTGNSPRSLFPYLILILVCLVVLVSYNTGAAPGFREARLVLNKFAVDTGRGWMSVHGQTAPTLPVEPAGRLQGVVHSWPSAGKMVALTFDDGPSKKFTLLYLNVLDRYGVHATFFLVGRRIQENPGLAAMIAGGGNELGCHGLDHRNLEQMDPAAAMRDITSAKQLIEQDSHTKVVLFRPPGGHLNQPLINMINGMGMKIVLWSIDPGDWYASPEKIIDNVLTNLQPGSIILLHEDKAGTLAALPTLIKAIRQRGYQLATVSELLASRGKKLKEVQSQH